MEKKCNPKLEQTTALPSHEQRLRMFSSQTPLTSGRCRKVDFLELTRVGSSEIRAEARSLSSVLPLTPASGSENQNKGLPPRQASCRCSSPGEESQPATARAVSEAQPEKHSECPVTAGIGTVQCHVGGKGPLSLSEAGPQQDHCRHP